jgi:hypothetical protein
MFSTLCGANCEPSQAGGGAAPSTSQRASERTPVLRRAVAWRRGRASKPTAALKTYGFSRPRSGRPGCGCGRREQRKDICISLHFLFRIEPYQGLAAEIADPLPPSLRRAGAGAGGAGRLEVTSPRILRGQYPAGVRKGILKTLDLVDSGNFAERVRRSAGPRRRAAQRKLRRSRSRPRHMARGGPPASHRSPARNKRGCSWEGIGSFSPGVSNLRRIP